MTIRQHLNSLPVKQSARAIKNTPKEKLELPVSCFNEALREAFDWHKHEGVEYWVKYLK